MEDTSPKVQKIIDENTQLKQQIRLNKLRNSFIFPMLCKFKNEIDYVDKIITIYAAAVKSEEDQLRQFEKDVLNYYLRFGYSTETKARIKKELEKSSDTITQATFYLKKKGYLLDSRTNLSKKTLSKDLQNIKKHLIDGDKKLLSIGFKRSKRA